MFSKSGKFYNILSFPTNSAVKMCRKDLFGGQKNYQEDFLPGSPDIFNSMSAEIYITVYVDFYILKLLCGPLNTVENFPGGSARLQNQVFL